MKRLTPQRICALRRISTAVGSPHEILLAGQPLRPVAAAPLAARSAVLFQDELNQGIPGWTAVKPRGVYWNGPLRWEYDLVHRAIVERSNIYTDTPLVSPSAIAPMLINGAVARAPFTYSACTTAGDSDAFGLVFGYQNETTSTGSTSPNCRARISLPGLHGGPENQRRLEHPDPPLDRVRMPPAARST